MKLAILFMVMLEGGHTALVIIGFVQSPPPPSRGTQVDVVCMCLHLIDAIQGNWSMPYSDFSHVTWEQR